MRVHLVSLDPDGADAAAAAEWLASAGHADADGSGAEDVLWVHGTLPVHEPPGPADLLRERWPRGGLLLTGAAAALPHLLGEEDEPPEVVRGSWSDAADELSFFPSFSTFPHIRGHASFRGHPLFEGLETAAYTWWPEDGEAFIRVSYVRPRWPRGGRVLAVERSYIHVNAQRGTIWEHDPGTLCIGAYLPLHADDPLFRPHVHRLLANALRYVAARGPGARPATGGVWRLHGGRPREDPDLPLPALPEPAGGLPDLPARPRLAGPAGEDRPLTLSGRRVLLVGSERDGIREAWAHPLRVLRDFEARAGGERLLAEEVAVTPGAVERRLRAGEAVVRERVVAAPDLAAAVLEWRLEEGPDALGLELSWESDLRLMWPYPPGCLGAPRWRVEGRGLVIAGEPADDVVVHVLAGPDASWEVGDATRERGDGPPTPPSRSGPPAGPAVRAIGRATLRRGDGVRLLLAASPRGAETVDAVLAPLRRPADLVHARAAAGARMRRRLSVSAPDSSVEEAVEWAKHRLDAFRAEAPGVGRSLVAGYAGSRPDWFHDGRPGYAWFFGRDAVWTALGSLAVGDFDAARDVLRFLGRHQDLSGKVLHECTTSGVVHYDAADATPLYLLLAARTFAWTGDRALLKEEWPRILRAYAFCLGTDRDGDGLIENTRVGHGWVEFGRLGGGAVTFYNASIWTAALRELAVTARELGEGALARELEERAGRAAAAIDGTFWDTEAGRYALSIRPDGTRNLARTVMEAVPLLLGVADPARSSGWLAAVAGDDFTAPWGVRMLPRDDPDYDAGGYHAGAVWPLFTGWASWAEYAAARPEPGFRHWMQNVRACLRRERGAWDEVLHGAEERAAGVCPDQGWSTAMAVAPLVYGLLGVRPDAARHRLEVRPQLPPEWDRLEIRRLRLGDALLCLRYARDGGRHELSLEQEEGAVPVRVILEPAFTGRLVRAAVDGSAASLAPRPFGDRTLVPLQVVLDAPRRVELWMESAG